MSVLAFQYPTSGRTAWSDERVLAMERRAYFFQYPTSGRTAWSQVWPGHNLNRFLLSVPYLGSNCLELRFLGVLLRTKKSFSTLPRVELPGAA